MVRQGYSELHKYQVKGRRLLGLGPRLGEPVSEKVEARSYGEARDIGRRQLHLAGVRVIPLKDKDER